MVRAPNSTNYFADAWEVRNHIDQALHQTLRRDEVGLAINSVASRSQDQLHIHFSCIRSDVWDTLHTNEAKIGDRWSPFDVPLYGRYYMAVWVQGEHLGTNNPFRLLAERLPDATNNMGDRTLVVIGFTRSNGVKGFVILTDRVNKDAGDLANGEELLDHSCQVAVAAKRSPGGSMVPGT
jgi:CDP-diacylglycerol pyrophosphatase